MAFTTFLRFLGEKKLGFFGCGHLGKAILDQLLKAGFPKDKIIAAHKGSEKTRDFLKSNNIKTVSVPELLRDAKCILYLVRPQEIADTPQIVSKDSIVVSFLAGVSVPRLQKLFGCNIIRLLPNSPDALRQQRALCAIYPSPPAFLQEFIDNFHFIKVPLQREEEMHDFVGTVCSLPNVFTFLDGKVKDVDILLFQSNVSFDYKPILTWAKNIYPHGLSSQEKEVFLSRAATKGGVNEAILNALRSGKTVKEALQAGISRSKELGK